MDDDELTQEWLKNPLRDPDTDEKIKPYSVTYDELYGIAYKYLQSVELLSKEAIQEKMPKLHLLFNGKYDLLYYDQNTDDFSNDEKELHEFIRNSIYKYGNNLKIPKQFKACIDQKYGVIESIVCYAAFDEWVEYLSRFMNYLGDLLKYANKSNSGYSTYMGNADMIDEQYEQVETLHRISQRFAFINQFNKVILTDWATKYIDKYVDLLDINISIKFYQIKSAFERPNVDIFDVLVSLFRELQKTYDFERRPEQSPIVVVKKLEFIEDPIQKIIDTLGAQSSPPTSASSSLNKSTSYSLSRSPTSSLSKQLASSSLNTSALSPAKTSSHTQSNKPPRSKHFYDMSLQDLMKINSSSNKSRQYYRDNILYKHNETNVLKCNHNIEAITQEDMNDNKYPLAKLQLIFQLHAKNTNNDIARTDCFYAPTFYNYIVNQILKNNPLINPITQQVIHRNDIDKLVDIMKTIIPDIVHPFIKTYDRDLYLYTMLSSDTKYYEFIIVKHLEPIKIKICKICMIPNLQEYVEDIMKIRKLMRELFNKQLLLHNYAPP